MNTTSNATTQATVKPKSKYAQALLTASRLLQAKQIKDQRNKALCVCLQYIGDNGDCPVHSKGFQVR